MIDVTKTKFGKGEEKEGSIDRLIYEQRLGAAREFDAPNVCNVLSDLDKGRGGGRAPFDDNQVARAEC